MQSLHKMPMPINRKGHCIQFTILYFVVATIWTANRRSSATFRPLVYFSFTGILDDELVIRYRHFCNPLLAVALAVMGFCGGYEWMPGDRRRPIIFSLFHAERKRRQRFGLWGYRRTLSRLGKKRGVQEQPTIYVGLLPKILRELHKWPRGSSPDRPRSIHPKRGDPKANGHSNLSKKSGRFQG